MQTRRTFLEKSILATSGILIAEPIAQKLMAMSTIDSVKVSPTFFVNKDGSYDIKINGLELIACYPAIDGVAIKPISVEVLGNSIHYKLAEGQVRLSLNTNNGKLSLSSSLLGFETAPHWFQPLAGAKVKGIQKYFYQGIGFAGPSGFADITQEPYKTPVRFELGRDETWLLESYICSGLINPEGNTLVVAATDHRNYLQKSTLYNREQRWGLINRHLLNEEVFYQCEFSLENIPLNKKELQLPDLHFVANESAWDAFVQMAKLIAKEMQVKPMKTPRYHWCSWYIKQKEFSYQDLSSFIDGVKKQNPQPFMQTIQIDDGYQTYYGDWLDFRTELWPGGIQQAFELIQKNKYDAGIWIAAFAVHKKSKVFAQHPEWCLRRKDGTYYEEFDGECVILDSSHPDAKEHIRQVFRYMKKAGVKFFKTDFMDWGFQDSVKCIRYTPGKTCVQYYREMLQMIREEIGDDSYWLACISPFPPFLGFADGVRVANDTASAWNNTEMDNVYSQMNALHYANNILFQNDPDVMYLNNKIFKHTDIEIESFAYFCGIMGGSVNTSEWLNDSVSVKLWRFLAPSGKFEQAILPNWSNNKKVMVALRKYDSENAWALLITNLSDKKIKETTIIKDLIGTETAHVYNWSHHGSTYAGSFKQIENFLVPHQSNLYYITANKVAPKANLSLGGKLL